MAALLGLALALAATWPLLGRQRFLGPYILDPIVYDLGFNPLNTALAFILLLIGLGWFSALFRKHQEHVDLRFALLGVVIALVAVMYRVLQDADLFSPFGEDLAVAGLPEKTSCAPDLGPCIDVLFVTPIFWMLIAFGSYALFLVAERTQTLHSSGRPPAAWTLYAASILLTVSPWIVIQATGAREIRFHPPWWFLLVSAAVGLLLVRSQARREGRMDWRWGLMGHFVAIGGVAAYFIGVWMSGGRAGWRPEAVQPWVPAVCIGGTLVLCAALAWKARGFARPGERSRPWVVAALLCGALVVEAVVFFLAVAHAGVDAVSGRAAASTVLVACVVPIAAIAGDSLLVARFGPLRFGSAPWTRVLLDPWNQLVVGSQLLDGLATGIGVDVFGAREKHVLARGLEELVASSPLDEAIGGFAMGFALIPFKAAFALLFVALLDLRVAPAGRISLDVLRLMKLAVVAVSLAPGLRDVLRLTMGV